jgi:aminoglycoside phosphotransferase (APT) family kinase protein
VLDAIEEVVRSIGRVPIRSERIEVGASNAVYRIWCDDGSQLIGRAGTDRQDRYSMELIVSDRARLAGVPCPQILTIDAWDGVDVMLAEYSPGARLSDAATTGSGEARQRLVRDAGRVLALVHSVETTGFGNLGADGQGLASTFDEWFVDGLARSLEVVGTFDPSLAALLDSIVEMFEANRSTLRASPCRLAHGDFSPTNLLVAGDRIVGVVDWESAKGGPPALDFGWWDWRTSTFPIPLAASDLLAGYQEVSTVDVSELAVLRRLVASRIAIGHLAWAIGRGDTTAVSVARRSLLRG